MIYRIIFLLSFCFMLAASAEEPVIEITTEKIDQVIAKIEALTKKIESQIAECEATSEDNEQP